MQVNVFPGGEAYVLGGEGSDILIGLDEGGALDISIHNAPAITSPDLVLQALKGIATEILAYIEAAQFITTKNVFAEESN